MPAQRVSCQSTTATASEFTRSKSYELAMVHSSMQQKQLTRSESTVEQWDSWPTLSDAADESHAKSSFERWVKSWKFERIFAIVLMSNAIFLGIQTQWSSMHLHDELPVAFLVLQMIYAALFILEICFRLAAWGLKGFFCSDDWLWHMLDVFVWLTAVLELVADIMSLEAQHATSSSGFRLLRIVKIARFARAIRIFKVLRFVRALRILVFSILHTLKSLIWSQASMLQKGWLEVLTVRKDVFLRIWRLPRIQ